MISIKALGLIFFLFLEYLFPPLVYFFYTSLILFKIKIPEKHCQKENNDCIFLATLQEQSAAVI